MLPLLYNLVKTMSMFGEVKERIKNLNFMSSPGSGKTTTLKLSHRKTNKFYLVN